MKQKKTEAQKAARGLLGGLVFVLVVGVILAIGLAIGSALWGESGRLTALIIVGVLSMAFIVFAKVGWLPGIYWGNGNGNGGNGGGNGSN